MSCAPSIVSSTAPSSAVVLSSSAHLDQVLSSLYCCCFTRIILSLCWTPVLRPLSYQPLVDCGTSLCMVLGIALLVIFYRTCSVPMYSILVLLTVTKDKIMSYRTKLQSSLSLIILLIKFTSNGCQTSIRWSFKVAICFVPWSP